MNMLDHDNTIEPMDELELYVLDLLGDDERADLEARLAADESLRQRVRELRGTLGMLAFELEAMEPPAGLRERILEQARSEGSGKPAQLRPVPDEHPQEESTNLFNSRLWVWASAAIFAFALIGVLVFATRDPAGEIQTYPVATTDATDQSISGEGRVREGTRQAILSLSGLQDPPAGRVYQVWLIAGDDPPAPNITFVPRADGQANLVIRGDVPSSDLIAITIEPQGGSPAPTSDVLIVSDLTQPDSG